MITNYVTYPSNGGETTGFLAEPELGEPYMGVVVIQEWWGLNAHIQDVTTRVAGAGAVALAPDLYHGLVATEPDEARKMMMDLDRPRAVKEINAAVDFLMQHERVFPKKIGVIGFCMGGGLAEQVAASNPNVAACVAFYGGRSPKAEAFSNPNAAVLSIVGELDEGILETQRELRDELTAKGMTFELVTYPGCDHAFFNDTRPEVYQVGAAHDAWARAMKFLRTHLKGEVVQE